MMTCLFIAIPLACFVGLVVDHYHAGRRSERVRVTSGRAAGPYRRR